MRLRLAKSKDIDKIRARAMVIVRILCFPKNWHGSTWGDRGRRPRPRRPGQPGPSPGRTRAPLRCPGAPRGRRGGRGCPQRCRWSAPDEIDTPPCGEDNLGTPPRLPRDLYLASARSKAVGVSGPGRPTGERRARVARRRPPPPSGLKFNNQTKKDQTHKFQRSNKEWEERREVAEQIRASQN